MKNGFLIQLKNQNGFLLMIVYLVISLVTIFSVAYFMRSVVFRQANERNIHKMVAFHMAESAVDWTIDQLNTDPDYTGTPAYVSMDTNFVQGGFTATVTKDAINPKIRIIQANGFSPSNDNTDRAYQTSSITVYCEYGLSSLFDFAVFAKDSISLTGTDKIANVDSYNSQEGAYDADTNSGSDGDIAVNSTEEGAITLNGTTLVDGDALIGPDGNPEEGIDIGNKAILTGEVSVLPEEQLYVTPSTTLPSSGDLDIHGEEILLPGIYHYSSLKISGLGKLTLTGYTEIYVDGSVDITGNGIATSSNLPTNLILYVIGSETVKIAGNGAFYGGIYAPNSLVQNDSDKGLFGAVVSKEYVQTGNSSIHYDTAMKEIESDKKYGKLKVLAWQEQDSLTWGTGT